MEHTTESSKSEIVSRIEAAKLRKLERKEKTEVIRFYIPIIVPFISTVAVFGALVFQAVQFKKSIEIQRQTIDIQRDTTAQQRSMMEDQSRTAEDAGWRDVVKTLSAYNYNAASGPPNLALLKSFLKDGRHRDEARDLAAQLLPHFVGNQYLFADLFNAAFDASNTSAEANDYTWDTLKKAIMINRRLKDSWWIYKDIGDAEFLKTGRRPYGGVPTFENTRGLTRQNPEYMMNQVGPEIVMVSTMLATYLRIPRSQDGERVDLTGSALWYCDLSGVSLRGSNLDNMYFVDAKLEDADLSAITKFARSAWEDTAWWRAKIMSVALLNYLKTYYPYNKLKYKGSVATTEDEYNQNILRLEALSKSD